MEAFIQLKQVVEFFPYTTNSTNLASDCEHTR